MWHLIASMRFYPTTIRWRKCLALSKDVGSIEDASCDKSRMWVSKVAILHPWQQDASKHNTPRVCHFLCAWFEPGYQECSIDSGSGDSAWPAYLPFLSYLAYLIFLFYLSILSFIILSYLWVFSLYLVWKSVNRIFQSSSWSYRSILSFYLILLILSFYPFWNLFVK